MTDDKLLTAKQVSDQFGIPLGTLLKARRNGTGPAHIRLGDTKQTQALYRPSDIRNWLEQNTFQSSGEFLANQK